MKVLIKRLDPDLPLPSYAKPGDAGADIYSRIDAELNPGERKLIPTGIAIALPPGFAAFVHPRSGRAIKEGLGMVNAPGTVDAAYRGELQVILINHDSQNSIRIKRGERIAQLVIQKVEHAEFIELEELPGSSRGASGFGSTGKS
ncbi:MAG: dUTP diphosphatase [Actinomycetales bacterium]|nr:dUTP diphosphatase [Actinomycetales bacterium]